MAESTHGTTQAEVLDANATFYRAFTDCDYAAMSELWAQRAPVTGFHPCGASPDRALRRARHMEADPWRPSRLELRCDQPIVRVIGETAIVMCYEGSNDEPAHLAATNVFVLEDGRWHMVHHHAGPISRPVPFGPSRSVN